MSESPEVTQPEGTQPRETPLLDRLRELDRRIAASVERVVYKLHQELGERVRSSNQDLLRLVEELKPEIPSTFLASEDLAPIAAQADPRAGRRAVHDLLEAVGRIDAASTQADVLAALLEQAQRFASRSAFFLTRAGVARGWASRGFGNDVAIESVEIEPTGLAALEELHRGQGPVAPAGGDRTTLGRWLEAPAGSEGVMIPFILRGQLGGFLYADRLERDGALDVESLQLLTYSAAQALETLAVRTAGISPVLRTGRPQDGEPAPLEPWEPAALPASYQPAPAFEPPAPDEPIIEAPIEEPITAEPIAAEPIAAEPAVEEPIIEEQPFEAQSFEEEPDVSEPALDETHPVFTRPEPVQDFIAEELPEAELEPAPEALYTEQPAVEEGVELFEPVAEPSPDVAEPDLEEYGVVTERPTREVVSDADLWPAEEEEMPAVDFAPSAVEATPIEPAPIELVEDVPDLVEPEVAYPDFPVGQQTVRLDISAFQTPTPRVTTIGPEDPTMFRSTAEVPTWEVEEPAAPVEPTGYDFEPTGYEVEPLGYDLEAETTPYEPITEAVPTTAPAVTSEDPTILGSRASLGIAPPLTPTPIAPTPIAPTPAAPPSPALEPEAEPVGSTQVQPPADIRGPGLAFSPGGGAAGHEALHEEARRLARLLVSEIKLYNEEIIEEGKREGNIYDRLREDVDRSRQMYEERIDPRIRGGEDYFYQELVQRLAGGDPRLLGM